MTSTQRAYGDPARQHTSSPPLAQVAHPIMDAIRDHPHANTAILDDLFSMYTHTTHTHAHTHTHTHTRTNTHTHTHTEMQAQTHTQTHANTHTHTHTAYQLSLF